MKKYKTEYLPEEMQKIINKLKQSKDKMDCLRKVYDAITAKHRGYRFASITNFPNLFVCNPSKLWDKRKRIICTNMNHLMNILLLESGFFKEGDVKRRWTLIQLVFPHQSLKVKIDDNKYVNIDIWGKVYGVKFGDYAHGFH